MPMSDYPSHPNCVDKGLHTREQPRQKDLVRRAVHLLLTVYLLPAICLVILVGGLAVVADGLARAFVWLAHQLPCGWTDDPSRIIAVGEHENRPRGPLVRRNPSHPRSRGVGSIGHGMRSVRNSRSNSFIEKQ